MSEEGDRRVILSSELVVFLVFQLPLGSGQPSPVKNTGAQSLRLGNDAQLVRIPAGAKSSQLSRSKLRCGAEASYAI